MGRDESFLPLQQRHKRTAKTQVVSTQRHPTLVAQIAVRWLTATVRLPRQTHPPVTLERRHSRSASMCVLLHLPCASARLPRQPAGSASELPWDPTTLGINVWIFCTLPRLWNIHSFFFCFFQRPKCLGLAIFSWFLTVDRFMQLLVIPVHGFPFWYLDTLDNGLTDGMPVPSAVSHIRGVSEVAQHTFFFVSQCQLIRSFPSHDLPNVCRELRLHHFLRRHVLVQLTNFHRIMLLLAWRPCTNILTGLSPSFCWFPNNLSALIKVSQTPCSAPCSKNVCFLPVRAVLYDQDSETNFLRPLWSHAFQARRSFDTFHICWAQQVCLQFSHFYPDVLAFSCQVVFHLSNDGTVSRSPSVNNVKLWVWYRVDHLHLVDHNLWIRWWSKPRRRLSPRRPFLWRRRSASHKFWYRFQRRTLRRGPLADRFRHGFDRRSFDIHFCLTLQSHTCFAFSQGRMGLRLNKFTIRVRENNLTIHIRIRERKQSPQAH